MKHVDKCAKARIIHENAAARKKAQLSRAANS
jgi:ribosomal protein S20